MSVQQNLSVKARDDVPDALLYAMPTRRLKPRLSTMETLPARRLRGRGQAMEPGPRSRRGASRGEEGVPSTQMLRYLRRVDDVTKGGLRWGMLTNGRQWRLYFNGALSVAEDFLEIDLGKVFDLPGCETDLLDRRPDGFDADAAWRAHVLKLFIASLRPGGFSSPNTGRDLPPARPARGQAVGSARCARPLRHGLRLRVSRSRSSARRCRWQACRRA